MRNARGKYALDLVNIFVADIGYGAGPFLAIYLTQKFHWNPGQIGWCLAASSVAGLAMAPFAGAVLDFFTKKRFVLACAFTAIAFCTFLTTSVPSLFGVILAQVGAGAASSFIAPGIAALSLKLVGPRLFANRVGRNEFLNHAGNLGAAFIAATVAKLISMRSVFFLVCLMSLSCVGFVVNVISDKDRTPVPAPENEVGPKGLRLSALLRKPAFIGLLALVTLYQFANACLLPLAAQKVAHGSMATGVNFVTAGIVIAQLTAAPAAWLSSKVAQKISWRFCLAAGFLAVAGRALIFATTMNPYIMDAGQLLDGIAGGVLTVTPILAAYELTRGSKHFLVSTGLTATFIGIGASLSNLCGGYLMEAYGSTACFITLAAIALTGMTLLAVIHKQAQLVGPMATPPI